MKENAFIAMCTFGKSKKGLEFFMESWLNRTQNLIGKENIEKLAKCHVAVFGCGGVGSYAIEALARSGVGKLTGHTPFTSKVSYLTKVFQFHRSTDFTKKKEGG